MLENCIELMLSAFYSQSRTIVRMNIDEDIRACVDFLSQLSVTSRMKQENEITVLPARQLKRGISVEIDCASARLAYLLIGISTALNLSVKINRLTSPIDEEQLKLFSQSLDNTFVFSLFGEGIAFSCFSTREMPSFKNIPNDALCAGVVLSSPFKAENVSMDMGNNTNGKYVNIVLDKIKLFSAEPQLDEGTLYISSLYEKRFVKNKIGENA